MTGTSDPANDWHVYLVECADGSLYTGVARDVEARVRQHNAGTGARYTRSRRPVVLVHREPAGTRSDALRREYQIKQLPADCKRTLISGPKTAPAPGERRSGTSIAAPRD